VRGRRRGLVKSKVDTDAPAGHAATFSAEAGLVDVVEEGEVVSPQPVKAEDEVRVAIHVELHEGGVLVKATQNQPGLDRAPRRSGGAVRLPDRGGVLGSRGPAARQRELRGKRTAQEAVRRARVKQALDPPPTHRGDEPAVDPGKGRARSPGISTWASEARGEGLQLLREAG